MLYIFTIATNQYSSFFENFKNSINNFYPQENKKLIVFSNKLQEYNNITIGKTNIEIISIPDLLYSSILLNKFNFINWYCKDHDIPDNQIIYFFDIDTYFYNNEFGQKYLKQELENHLDLVLFSSHLYNLVNKNEDLGYYVFVHGFFNNRNDNGGIQPQIFNDYSFTKYKYLPNQDIITSFFCGTINSIKNLNNKYTELYKEILHSDRILPNYLDEDICNYILLGQLLNKLDKSYIFVPENNLINFNVEELDNKNRYKYNTYDNLIKEEYNKYLIINQKYNISIKSF